MQVIISCSPGVIGIQVASGGKLQRLYIQFFAVSR